MADEQQGSGGNRQKITIGVMIVVVAVIIWQAMGLFGGGSGSTPPPPAVSPARMQAAMDVPKPAKLAEPEIMSEREAQLMRLQQETEAKYVAALSELQMLRVERDIADTNKAISKAKFDNVKAQKDIVDLLTAKPEPPPAMLTPGLAAPTGLTPTQQPSEAPVLLSDRQIKYTVISVSKAHSKWTAVLAGSGKLYSVHPGDIMPEDAAKVIDINNYGVTIERDGKKEKISLVPII